MADRAERDKKGKNRADRERTPSRPSANISSGTSGQDQFGRPAPARPTTQGSEPKQRSSSKDPNDRSRQSSHNRGTVTQSPTEMSLRPAPPQPTNTTQPSDKGKKYLDPGAKRFSPEASKSASQHGYQSKSEPSAPLTALENPPPSPDNIMEARALLMLGQVAFVTDLPPNVDGETFSEMMAKLGPVVVAELCDDKPAIVIWQSPRITFDAVNTLNNEDWGTKRVFAWVADPTFTSREYVAEWLFRGAATRQDWGILRVYDPRNLIQAEDLDREFGKYSPGQSQIQLRLNGRRTGMAFLILKSVVRANQVANDYRANTWNINQIQVGVEDLRLDTPYLTAIKPRFTLMAKNIFVGLETQMYGQVVPDFTKSGIAPIFVLLRDEKRKWRGTAYMIYQTAEDRDLAVYSMNGTFYFQRLLEVYHV